MSKKQEYGSRFLYAEDLLFSKQYHTVTVEVAEVIPPRTLEAANGKSIDKYTLRFAGKEKMLVLCKTNIAMIVYVTGDAVENCVGKKLTLQPRYVEAFGDKVTAIRIMPPEGMKIRRGLKARLGEKAVWEESQA